VFGLTLILKNANTNQQPPQTQSPESPATSITNWRAKINKSQPPTAAHLTTTIHKPTQPPIATPTSHPRNPDREGTKKQAEIWWWCHQKEV